MIFLIHRRSTGRSRAAFSPSYQPIRQRACDGAERRQADRLASLGFVVRGYWISQNQKVTPASDSYIDLMSDAKAPYRRAHSVGCRLGQPTARITATSGISWTGLLMHRDDIRRPSRKPPSSRRQVNHQVNIEKIMGVELQFSTLGRKVMLEERTARPLITMYPIGSRYVYCFDFCSEVKSADRIEGAITIGCMIS